LAIDTTLYPRRNRHDCFIGLTAEPAPDRNPNDNSLVEEFPATGTE